MDVTAAAPQRGFSIVRMLLLLLIAVVAMGNGLYFSPYFDKLLILIPRLASAFFIRGQEAIFYLTGFSAWMLTLVIAGGKSPEYMRNAQAAIVAQLPHGRLVTLPGQTHMVRAKATAPVLAEHYLG